MRRDTECFEAHQYILTARLAVEDLSKTTTAVNVRSRLCGAALIVRSLAAVLKRFTRSWQQRCCSPALLCSANHCRSAWDSARIGTSSANRHSKPVTSRTTRDRCNSTGLRGCNLLAA